MRRFRLEIVLVAALAATLGFVVVAGPGDRGDPALGGAVPSPCEGAPRIEGLGEIGRDGDLDAIIGVVERLRSLEFTAPPAPVYLEPAAFSDRVASEPVFREGEAELLQDVLVSLGAIPEDYDLERELTETTTEGVIGFYDPETEELVVKGTGGADGFTGLERMTLVHELEHALADQVHGLRRLDDPDADEDALAAYRALVEGDAELVTEMYASQALGFTDALEIGLAAGPSALSALDAPHFLVRSLSFPYLEGSVFACHLFERGGWAAVDAAYANPPRTTAEILFPETYPAPAPADPPDPAGPGKPWRHEAELGFGAADLLFLLEAPGGDPAAAVPGAIVAVARLRGGELHVWRNGDASAVGLSLVARSAEGGGHLCRAMTRWDASLDAAARTVRCTELGVLVGIAPDAAVASALTG